MYGTASIILFEAAIFHGRISAEVQRDVIFSPCCNGCSWVLVPDWIELSLQQQQHCDFEIARLPRRRIFLPIVSLTERIRKQFLRRLPLWILRLQLHLLDSNDLC